jgi:hypothetical protein
MWVVPNKHNGAAIPMLIIHLFQMPELELKLANELHNDAHVVACRFPFPTWTPDATLGIGVDTVWLYKNPPRININSAGHPES